MDMKEKLLAEMEQSDFAKNNGKIMRTLKRACAELPQPEQHSAHFEGRRQLARDNTPPASTFWLLEGYILLRTVKDHVRCEDLADHNWTELEAKLSGKGMRVLEKDVKDAMIEV